MLTFIKVFYSVIVPTTIITISPLTIGIMFEPNHIIYSLIRLTIYIQFRSKWWDTLIIQIIFKKIIQGLKIIVWNFSSNNRMHIFIYRNLSCTTLLFVLFAWLWIFECSQYSTGNQSVFHYLLDYIYILLLLLCVGLSFSVIIITLFKKNHGVLTSSLLLIVSSISTLQSPFHQWLTCRSLWINCSAWSDLFFKFLSLIDLNFYHPCNKTMWDNVLEKIVLNALSLSFCKLNITYNTAVNDKNIMVISFACDCNIL